MGRLFWRLARECKQLLRILRQMLPHLDFVGVIFDVIIAVRQRQPALIDVCNHVVRIVQV